MASAACPVSHREGMAWCGQQGMCNQATLLGLHSLSDITRIRDLLHFPAAPRNSKQFLGASPLLYLTEKMESSEAAAKPEEQGVQATSMQLQHLPHGQPSLTRGSWQAKVHSTGTPFALAKGTLGNRKKHSREGREEQTAGRHAGGTACLSLSNAPGSSMDLFGP